MRQYCYYCPVCDKTKSEFRATEDRNDTPMCLCGTIMERDMKAEMGVRRFPEPHEVVYKNASVGLDQIKEANADLQKVGLRDCHYDADGNPHCPNRERGLKFLEHRGLFNADECRSPKHWSGPLMAGKKVLKQR